MYGVDYRYGCWSLSFSTNYAVGRCSQEYRITSCGIAFSERTRRKMTENFEKCDVNRITCQVVSHRPREICPTSGPRTIRLVDSLWVIVQQTELIKGL